MAAQHRNSSSTAKESRSLEDTYRRYRAELVSFFARRTRERANVEDLVQQVYERLLKYRPRAPVMDPRAYLFQTARHVLSSANETLRQDRERYVVCDENSLALRADAVPSLWVEEEGGEALALEEFERVLSELPSNCQVALVRQRRDGWSYQEIASELQVSVNSVKHYIVLALEHFQVHFSMPAKARLTLKDRS